MGSFNYDTFSKVLGNQGSNIINAVGMSFGMPSCLLNLVEDALRILPKPVLNSLQKSIMQGKQKANAATSAVFEALTLNSGLIEFDTETGTLKFKSDSSWLGMDDDDAQSDLNLGSLNDLFELAAMGDQIYQNYLSISDQIADIGDCIKSWGLIQSYDGGNAANQEALLSDEQRDQLFDEVYGAHVALLENTAAFINGANASLKAISNVIQERLLNPSLEPRILNTADLDAALSGSNFPRFPLLDPGQPTTGVCLGADADNEAACVAGGGIWVTEAPAGVCIGADATNESACLAAGGNWVLQTQEDIFRLVYGPPISQSGQYLLTSDGLYYDSQKGGLDPVFLAISGIVPVGEAWQYNYDPNLGGRGDAISIKSLDSFTDNLFDISLVDDSIAMQNHYNTDHFLSVLIGSRDKHIFDLSASLETFISEYGENSSVVKNQRQQIMSDIANHNNKINRRKKQIEVAIKAPEMYGNPQEPIPIFPLGEVPVNDFSYLENLNLVVDLEKQKALIFEQGEVTGMVLPIRPTFVASPPKPPSLGFQHLNVPPIGKGSILYTPSGTQLGTVLSLTDQIVTDQLFAIYNFLETKVVTPSSLNYYTTNCATPNLYNNAKMVGTNKKTIYKHGLSVPFLEGITKNKSTDTAAASALGSFLRLPDTPEFRELTYNNIGFTIEFWSYIPDILNGEIGWASGGASSLTKVVLGCENVGVQSGVSSVNYLGEETDLDFLPNERGDQFVRGMLMGFTRDRRITKAGYPLGASGYSNHNYDNDPTSSLSFFIAPTQAQSSTACSWINNVDCQDNPSFYSMKVDLSATKFGSVSSQYVLVDITLDPHNNEVNFYADGTLVATSGISDVFGVPPYTTPNLPSFKKANSFEYGASTVDGPTTLHEGPKLNQFYTPWIVGGGYTDGMSCCGNFMGGDRGGIQSGYDGFLGSLKFYAKPLNSLDVKENFEAQKGYFKNIDTKLHEVNYETGEGFNVVLILMDDIGVEQLGIYDGTNPLVVDIPDRADATPFSTLDAGHSVNGENWYPHTPALSSMAENGIVFQNAHATPYCTPTRASILTGKHPFSSPYYDWGDGSLGLWGHGMGDVPTTSFEKTRSGLNSLGVQQPFWMWTQPTDIVGTSPFEYGNLSHFVKSPDGADSVWDAKQNFRILPNLMKSKGYKTYMAGKWHLNHWNQIATHYERGLVSKGAGFTWSWQSTSGTGWSGIPEVGEWDNYAAVFANVNKVPIPGKSPFNPHTTSSVGQWLPYEGGPYPILDAHMGYINYFMNIDGNITTVSDTGYTCIVSSLDQVVTDYTTGNPDSYVTNRTFAEASGFFETAEEPFFMYLPVNAAHLPYTLPPSGNIYNWTGMYDTSNIQARVDATNGVNYQDITVSSAYINTNAQIENFDYMFSSFLSSISVDRRERTLFLVLGDNGTDRSYMKARNAFATSAGSISGCGPTVTKLLDNNGETYRDWGKGGEGNTAKAYKTSVYETGTKIPLLASASFISPGETYAFVDTVDIYPTIAAIAKADLAKTPFTQQLPQRAQGTSFLPVLSGAATHSKQFSFTEMFHPIGYSVASATSMWEADGVINDEDMGTAEGKVGKYSTDGESLTTATAYGGVGQAIFPYERRRGWSVKGTATKFGNHTASGADHFGRCSNSDADNEADCIAGGGNWREPAVYGDIPAASAGTWKLVRSTSGHEYDELYHLRDIDDNPIDPYELNDLIPSHLKGLDPWFYQRLLNMAVQSDNNNTAWILARIYYTVAQTFYDYIKDRNEPNLQ